MHTVNRRLHWWRGLACGLIGLALLTWALPAVTAQEETSKGGQKGLAQRVAALEKLLKHFSREGNEIFITGANLHLVNGLGATETTNGLGNLIVGYSEPRDSGETRQTGSHNVVVGKQHRFSSFGGLVGGLQNESRGAFASVSGDVRSTAASEHASISGGRDVRLEAKEGWAAGSMGAEVAGRFRSP
jgi:hypothetical protein